MQGLCVLISQVSSVGGYHDEGEEPPHACPHSCETQGTIVQGLSVYSPARLAVWEDIMMRVKNHHMPALILARSREQIVQGHHVLTS